MALITTWKVTCFALTKRSLSLLYGAGEGSENVAIKFEDQTLTLNLEDDYVYYSWHRMLNIVGNPNYTINNPAIYFAFISGLELLINQYLSIGPKRENQRYMLPTGNTLFHIFGSWLFDSIHLDRNGFDEGTALALKIISSVVAAKYKTDLLPVYIASYYSSLQSALSKEGRVLLAAITSSTTLFTYEIKGIRSLVPYFVGGIQRILSKRAGGFENVMPTEQVRKACLTILGTIICLPNHFVETKFMLRSKDKQSKVYDVDSYSSLKKLYTMILTEALSNETYACNIETLLNLTQIWQAEDIDFSAEFTKNSISLIVRKISGQGGWIPEVSLFAMKSLCSMSNLYPKIDNGQEQANLIVNSLCKHLTALFALPNPDKTTEDLIVQLYKCILDWVMTDQWIINFTETKSLLLKTLVIGLKGTPLNNSSEQYSKELLDPKKKKEKKKDEKVEKKDVITIRFDRIKDIAQTCLSCILNHIGNFPSQSGASVVSTLAKEEEILFNICNAGKITPAETKDYIRYFITEDKVIICVIDRRYDEGGPYTCVIVRDSSGRYAWDTKLTHIPYRQNPDLPQVTNFDTPIPVCTTAVSPESTIDSSNLGDILQYLQAQNSKNAFKMVEYQVVHEQKLLKQTSYRLDANISIEVPKPADPYVGDCKIQQSRILLSHLGFLSLENRDKLFPLIQSEAFFQSLKALDQLPERECIKTAVVFIRKGQTDEEYLANEGGSLDYQEFIASLGWGVKLSMHRGYMGSLEPQFCTVAPYWSNYSTEIMFHVTTLMANTSSFPDHTHKKRQILNAVVVVVWAEDQQDFQPQLWARVRHNIVFVVITPLEHGLYFVKVLSKNDLIGVGPLIDGVVVSKAVLGYLVRETSITAYRRENSEIDSPFLQRSAQIENLYQQFKKTTSLEQFYTSLFTSLSVDQMGPTPQQIVPFTPVNAPSSPSTPPTPPANNNNNNNTNNNQNLPNNSPNRAWGKPPSVRPEKKEIGWAGLKGSRTTSSSNFTLGDQRDSKKSSEDTPEIHEVKEEDRKEEKKEEHREKESHREKEGHREKEHKERSKDKEKVCS